MGLGYYSIIIKQSPRSLTDRVHGFGPCGGGSIPPGDTTIKFLISNS